MSGSEESFEARLRQVGRDRCPSRHPFIARMHEGTHGAAEIGTWVRSRYYLQTQLPIADATILARAPDAGFRRCWIRRIRDSDGRHPGEGLLEQWLILAEAVGLERADVERCDRVLPGVRAACDALVRLVEGCDLLESVATSLTDCGTAEAGGTRIAAFERHYPWIGDDALGALRTRCRQARRDGAWSLAYTIREARTDGNRQRCEAALTRKCEILWNLLDAVEAAHARPALSPHAQLRADSRTEPATVVLPERAVQLNESGREILGLCDGERTALDVAAELHRRHPDGADVETDVHEFLARMRALGVLHAVAR